MYVVVPLREAPIVILIGIVNAIFVIMTSVMFAIVRCKHVIRVRCVVTNLSVMSAVISCSQLSIGAPLGGVVADET